MRLADQDLLGYGSYRRLVEEFEWDIPERMNMASEVFDRWSEDRGRVAIYVEHADGRRDTWSYWRLIRLAKRYANFLVSLGVQPGDRVSLVMHQGAELAALHLAVYAVGAVALPMSILYGPDSYRHILSDSATGVIVVGEPYADPIRSVRDDLPDLATVVISGQPEEGERSLTEANGYPADFVPVDTASEDPALLLYTSGSTGHPKGALHAHRILEGYLLTFKLFFNVEFDESTVFYTPSDWAWVGGLLDILLPALVFGRPVVADEERFSAERAFEVIGRNGVTHAFLTPTALKVMAQVPDPGPRFDLDLRVIASGGESVADELHRWSERRLGAVINEFYGLTEVNHLVGGCEALWPGRPGWMGLPYPGREVAVLGEDGEEIAPGEIGEIAVRPGDPTQMLEYWANPAATAGMRRDGWIMTGDQALLDADGYIRFLGRDDDMIASAGYRIGPAEVEESLVRHPAVAEVAVIPAPDQIRGNVVKAMVVLADGCRGDDQLTAELQAQVKTQLAAYKYPRIVQYVDRLPKTSTGKLNRKLLAAQARSA
ncbi:MAG: AMP-binding protein [Acidimicrobiia bacterium]|nr:AMP-binding protein [Acidimicrobiia bacterium]MYB78850.1 AMP-binding protein [Acidimicrobiia bacterium]MYH05924.1 AMP-binding protein [Acidimicrobiia bacterium]